MVSNGGTERHLQMAADRYMRSIFALIVTMAIVMTAGMVGIYLMFIESNKNQEILIDCTDRRRSHSECQQYANERTKNAITAFSDIVEAYVICADRLDGDAAIKRCVVDTLGAAQNPR